MKKALLLLVVLLVSFQLNAQWTVQTSGTTVQLNSVSAVDDNVCWIGGNSGVILRTTNGGTTWTNVGGGPVIGTTNALYNIFALDANNCLATASPAATFLYRTTNGGTTWTQVFTQASPGFIDAIWMFTPTTGMFYGDPVGSRWTLFRTNDGGATWDSTGFKIPQAGTEAGWNNAMQVLGNNIWFGTNNTKIYASTNLGTTWAAQTTTGEANSYALWFNSQTNGMMGGTTSVLETTNGGTTWTIGTTLPGSGNINGISGSGNLYYATRQANAIYSSSNSGVMWLTSYTAPLTTSQFLALAKARTGTAAWAITIDGIVVKGTIGVVPVELTSFTATTNNGVVSLKWNTATETNNRGFEVQRKSANTEFVNVGFVNGNGTTTESRNFSFSEKVQPGTYSYRLRQVDFDGHSDFSKEVEVSITAPLNFSLDQNYPNPFNPATTINYSVANSGLVKIAVYNMLGQQVKELVNEVKEAGTYNVSFNASSLTSGTYFYKIETAQFSQVKKMVLMK